MTEDLALQLERAAHGAGMHPGIVDKYIDVSKMTVGKDGTIVGLDEAVASLKESNPYLFKYRIDPKGDIKEQLARIGREMKDARNSAELQLVRSLDVNELNDAELDSVVHVLTGRAVYGDRSRLEFAAKRQSDTREAEHRRLTQAI